MDGESFLMREILDRASKVDVSTLEPPVQEPCLGEEVIAILPEHMRGFWRVMEDIRKRYNDTVARLKSLCPNCPKRDGCAEACGEAEGLVLECAHMECEFKCADSFWASLRDKFLNFLRGDASKMLDIRAGWRVIFRDSPPLMIRIGNSVFASDFDPELPGSR